MKLSFAKPLQYALYLALLIAGIFAAMEVHKFVLSRGTGSPPAQSYQTTDGAQPSEDTASAPANPMQLTTMPARAGGLEPFSADPEGIAPPAGAHATDGYQQKAYHALRQQRVYECTTALATAADHYRRTLKAQWFVPISEMPSKDGLFMDFARSNVHVSVAIRTVIPAGKTRITVTASRSE